MGKKQDEMVREPLVNLQMAIGIVDLPKKSDVPYLCKCLPEGTG